MIPLLGGFVVALGLSLVLTVAVRRAAPALGLVDRPDGSRKLHRSPTPNVGGVAIFGAGVLTLLLGLRLGIPQVQFQAADPAPIRALILGGCAIFALGVVDDARGLRPWTKLAVEAAVALAVVAAGVRIQSLGAGGLGGEVPLLLGVPLTVLWLVGITNSFNLLDGSDGVAGGAAFFAFLTLGIVSLLFGKSPVAAVSFVLAGATLGFLYFNFPPASIFMGDSGSLFLGFTLAGMGVLATQKAPTVLAIAIPLVAFGVPILDTALAIARRFLRREGIFSPDRGHIHHRLRDLGQSPRRVAFTVYALTAVFSVLSLLLAGGRAAVVGFGLALMGAVVVVFVQRLRSPEFLEWAKLFTWGRLQRVVVERNMRVRQAAERLHRARTQGEVLTALEHAFGDGEFTRLELWLEDRYASALKGQEWTERAGHYRSLALALLPPHD
ncbi:MAG TPA: MraY family glycosyltransferase, partial [Longimicrobiales bacterium]|nr:MraY family glycosyltransferase [Longimicrobiales bacterium]